MMELTGNIAKLEKLLPVIAEKEKSGAILPSLEKARSLIAWARMRPLTEKQELLVGRLIVRAERKHRNGAEIKIEQNLVASVDEDALFDKLAKRFGQQSVDVNAVAKLVLEQMEARRPRQVEITVKLPDGKASKSKGPTHAQFERLARAANARLANGYAPGIFLQGEASSGKTTGARQLAELLKLDWHFNGAITFPHEMLGFIDGNGKYHRTPFRDAYEHGGVYTFDEVDRSDANALLAVNPHLANGVATFPDRQIKRHKDCIIVCTANTWGLGADANYSGATKLDAAFLSRFPVRINWDIDPMLEEAIVPHAAWLAKVRGARVRARACGLKVLIDTRVAQAGAALIEAGYADLREVAEMTYLANLKPEQKKQVEGV